MTIESQRRLLGKIPFGRSRVIKKTVEVKELVYEDQFGKRIENRFTVDGPNNSVTVQEFSKEKRGDSFYKRKKASIKVNEEINGDDGRGLTVKTSKRIETIFSYKENSTSSTPHQ